MEIFSSEKFSAKISKSHVKRNRMILRNHLYQKNKFLLIIFIPYLCGSSFKQEKLPIRDQNRGQKIGIPCPVFIHPIQLQGASYNYNPRFL
jgi:hypothetical protein